MAEQLSGAADREIDSFAPLTQEARGLTAPEMLGATGDAETDSIPFVDEDNTQ